MQPVTAARYHVSGQLSAGPTLLSDRVGMSQETAPDTRIAAYDPNASPAEGESPWRSAKYKPNLKVDDAREIISIANDFRPEIAGLRAVAVISVILFHLKVSSFHGGFVGVDIFFVISGYLISRNILSDRRSGRFSFGQFYIRRTRRIFPALIFTVVATYVCGALWCSPDMFLDLAKECTHALLSIANIQYWREAYQYFAPDSDDLALLHCWSLSLEEQFYLFWPILIVIADRFNRAFEVIALAALASFLLANVVSNTDPLAAFFLMPFRLFEFAVGAMVLPFEKRFRLAEAFAESLSAVGMLLIAASVLLFRSDLQHLTAAILLPCLGAATAIWAGDKTRAAKLLTNPMMVAVGGISYSLYLCHWPIIFFGRFIFGDRADTLMGTMLMVALMVAVATAMNLLIERRFIQSVRFRSASFLKNAAAFCSVLLMLAALTHSTFLSRGFTWRMPATQPELMHLQGFPTRRDMDPITGPVRFELMGDSLTEQYAVGLSPILKQLNKNIEVLDRPGCPLLYGVMLKSVRREECITARDQTLEYLSRIDLPIIFVQKWSAYDDAAIDYEVDTGAGVFSSNKGSFTKLDLALRNTIARMISHGNRILIIGEQPDPSCVIKRPRLLQGPLTHAPIRPCPPISQEAARQSTAPIDRILSGIQARWPHKVELLLPTDYFCDTVCPVVKEGIWLYIDRIHLTLAGTRYMIVRHADVFRDFLEKCVTLDQCGGAPASRSCASATKYQRSGVPHTACEIAW
jgi:peptidoglycan/LPS O-acetylase OafA/YrhL